MKMGKQLRVWSLAILVTGLTAMPAFAGAVAVNHGAATTALTVALEVSGIARAVGIVGPGGTDAVVYTAAQNVADQNLIVVALTGATFVGGNTYRICELATNTEIAQATPAAGVSSVNFQVVFPAGVPVGTGMALQDAGACAAGGQPVNFSLNATGSPTTAIISFTLTTSALVVVDPIASANLAAIAAKYSAAVANSSHVIDVAVAAGADGTQFTAATGTDAAGLLGGVPTVQADSGQGSGLVASSFALTVTGKDVDENTNTNGNPAPGLTTTANIILANTDFSGISLFRIVPAGLACSAGNALVSSGASPTIPTTLTLPADGAGGVDETTAAGTKNYTLCTLVNDTTFLNPRVITGSVDFNTLTALLGANDPAPTSAAAVQTWTINGADIRVTGVRGGPTGNETNISINNLGPTNGTIRRLEIYRIGTTLVAGLAAPSCVVSNIPGATFSLWSNAGNNISATGLLTSQCSGQAPFITGDSAEAYGVRLVLDIAPGSVGASANRILADGRIIPLSVLKGGPGAAFAVE
jgi:hypothetical protein